MAKKFRQLIESVTGTFKASLTCTSTADAPLRASWCLLPSLEGLASAVWERFVIARESVGQALREPRDREQAPMAVPAHRTRPVTGRCRFSGAGADGRTRGPRAGTGLSQNHDRASGDGLPAVGRGARPGTGCGEGRGGAVEGQTLDQRSWLVEAMPGMFQCRSRARRRLMTMLIDQKIIASALSVCFSYELVRGSGGVVLICSGTVVQALVVRSEARLVMAR